MRFLDFVEVKYDSLKKQTTDYLKRLYSKSDENFSNASPFGQVLNVLNNFWRYNVLMQKRIITNIIIDETDNKKVINSLSRIGGHNPTRALSASGTIILKTKPNTNINSDISGGRIRIGNKTRLRNKTNGLSYCISIGKDEEIYQVSQSNNIYLNVVQGRYETQTYTGSGEINQSISVNIPVVNSIDNFDVKVDYNGNNLTIKDSIFDMDRYELSCVVKTGMNGGIDICFGNGDFGFIPRIGTRISVTYLLTDGILGNIQTPQINDFDFVDDVYDMNGDKVDMESTFDVIVHKKINFASNGETSEFTKNLMPYVSRNFVLSTPSQYVYALKKLNLFSKINVYNTLNDNDYENDNMVYLFLVPNLKNYFTGNVNYFNLPLDSFYLDDEEKEKTITYLRKMGNVSIGSVLEIIQPKITKYIMNIYIRKYKGYLKDSIKLDIITKVSDYLSTLDRDDRIVKSDIIRILEYVEGVDSVNLSFISKKNEDYHKINTDSKFIYGIDPVLGDIIVNKDELAIIRGGWSDRNGTYYNDNIDGNGLGPINIMFVGDIEKNINTNGK